MAFGHRKEIQSPYFATGNPETEEMTTLYAPGMLGCLAQFDQGGIAGPPNICTYQLVKQDTGIQAAVGNPFLWKTKSSYIVTTVVTNLGLVAGVAQIAAANTASYIWIAKRGNRSVLFIGGPTSAPDATGKPVTTAGSATQGNADCLAHTTAVDPGSYIGAATGATAANIAPVNLNITDPF